MSNTHTHTNSSSPSGDCCERVKVEAPPDPASFGDVDVSGIYDLYDHDLYSNGGLN